MDLVEKLANEYKRAQATPGIKVTRAFGLGRRMLIAQQDADVRYFLETIAKKRRELHRVGIEPTTR